MTNDIKPSDVMDIFPSMGLGDFYAEQAAAWTAAALAATGDTWRPITWAEIEPMLDESFTETHRRLFKKYLPCLDSAKKAANIWRNSSLRSE